ncbi:probable GPI-anchored adhesin-like protein PGA55 isoform X2 [Harpegnathos saltator]|nr:probable GPI-anchored adhesin-like protein PGA55 isoform X2 [Harpegnathos saltator]
MEMEIICISSDDESDSQKENKKNSSPDNFTETSNNALHTKVEITSSHDEKVEENNLKRKVSQISRSSSNIVEKRRKLNTNQNTSELNKEELVTSDCILVSKNKQTVTSAELTAKIPKLVVKERKKISYIAHDIFPQFISLCLNKSRDNDMKKIVDKLKRRYEGLDSSHAGSESFALFLNEKREAIIQNKRKLYVHIQEVMNEIKNMIKDQLKKKQTNNVVYDAIPSTSYAANKESINKVIKLDEDDNSVEIDKKRKIKTILMAMKKCDLRIKKFETAEVDFNEDADSNYIKMERYKQRMVELYSKLCELTDDNADAGRSYLRPKHISTTQIVAVDQAISNFINSKISKQNRLKKRGAFTNNLIFPDYRDILECVNRCNIKRNLGLDKRKLKHMAKKAFTELGEYLQRARRNDYWDTFSLYLENAEEDPALKDKELASKLAVNRSEGDKRLAAVFEKYRKKQEDLKNQVIDSGTSTEDESDVDNDEKDEDEGKNKDDDNDTTSLYTLSSEDSSNEEDISEIIEDKILPTESDKGNTANANTVMHVKCDTNKAEAMNVERSVPQEKSDKKLEVKSVTREDDAATSKDENKTTKTSTVSTSSTSTVSTSSTSTVSISSTPTVANEEKVHRPSISNAVVTSRNITETSAKVQVSSSPTTTAPTNCADADRIEEHVEVIIEDMRKVITNSMAEVITESETTEVLMEDTTEVEAQDIAEVARNVQEMITKVTELASGATLDDVSITDTSDDKDETKKPLLRVRSFAKPPTTWDDERNKMGKEENVPKITSQNKDVIDLTDESNVTAESAPSAAPPVLGKCAIQLGKVVPLVKTHQTLMLPPGSNIINVQNITNNYLKLDVRTGEIIAPACSAQPSGIIHVPSTQIATVRQDQSPSLQNSKVSTTTDETKRNETVVKIVPQKIVTKTSEPQVSPKTPTPMTSTKTTSKVQVISTNTTSPMTKPQIVSKQLILPKQLVVQKQLIVPKQLIVSKPQAVSKPPLILKSQAVSKPQVILKPQVISNPRVMSNMRIVQSGVSVRVHPLTKPK